MAEACGVIRPNRHACRAIGDAGTRKRAVTRGNVRGLERGNGTRPATWGRGGAVSGATGATEATGTAGDGDAFAVLLRGLKERSGLSYGALSKRLHMSTSTLHRYCNGSAVPTDYAPVEQLARVCRATPEELVELHRQWILADAARGRKGPGPGRVARGAGTEQPEEAPTPDASTPDTRHPTPGTVLRAPPIRVTGCPRQRTGPSRRPWTANSANPPEATNRSSPASSRPLPRGLVGAAPRSSPPSPRPPCWEPSCSP
ncbi:helix-turn-helix domain-containing protein [Streptomyces noursei]|uniref:helix-turn-helix domain-containing protein n=1 Tax=Streptomyces noursei TaxID=1971 RepID=UPI0037F1EE5A